MLGHARGKRRPQERGTKKMGYMKYLKLMNRMNAVTQVPQPPVPQFEKYCKMFVTDEEYDIMMGMKLRGNTEAELRALYTGSDWAGTLYDMCRKGFLLKIYDGAEPTYDLAPMLPGWFEFPLSTGEDSDTIQKASELFTSAINMVTTLNVEPLRTGYAVMNNLNKLKGDKAVEALKELIVSDAKDQYSDFEDKLGSEGLRQLERRVVLAVLDRKWREHLYEMDYLKDGIGLRGMGQRDPLVEYQREGYQMYNSMIEAIKEETIQLLFHVDIERVAMTEDEETESDEDEAVNAAEAVMGLDGEAAATGESAPAEPETDDEAEKTTIDELADEQKNEKGIVGMQPISHAEGKVPANKRPKSEELHSPWADGRTFPGTGKNAQCPCGSGRKYKMCHGQNEE